MSVPVGLRPGLRTMWLGSAVAVVIAVASASAVVVQATYSSLSSTTGNAANSWGVGSVVLSDDDAGSSMFSVGNIAPGASGTRCIAVTSTGSLPSTVTLYGTGFTNSHALSDYIDLTVTLGTGGTFGGGCTGFTADPTNPSVFSGTLTSFAASATSFSSGLGVWAPSGSGSETRVYRFAYVVDSAAPSSTGGGTSGITFTWEAQNS